MTHIVIKKYDLWLVKAICVGAGILLGFTLWAWALWLVHVSFAVSDLAREALR